MIRVPSEWFQYVLNFAYGRRGAHDAHDKSLLTYRALLMC